MTRRQRDTRVRKKKASGRMIRPKAFVSNQCAACYGSMPFRACAKFHTSIVPAPAAGL
jgi:hypothetical protein